MIRIKEAILVEGRYDKSAIARYLDTMIVEAGGFHILKDEKKLALLRALAATRGLVILTDSDGAGFLIRNKLKSMLPREGVLHAYIPDVPGKERRKAAPSAEGKLGVEGMSEEQILASLKNAGATFEGQTEKRQTGGVTKADLMLDGLVGAGSTELRARLLKRLDLPEHMSANALLEYINSIFTINEYKLLVIEIKQ